MGFKVLIPQKVVVEGEQYLLERGYEIVTSDGITVDALKAAVVDCDAILARTAEFPAEVLEAGKKLKVIARHGVGVNNIDVAAATKLGIQVTFTPLANSNTVAEQTIGMLLALSRNLLYIDRQFRQGNWKFAINCRERIWREKRWGLPVWAESARWSRKRPMRLT